jgi:hypothetical protein
MRRAVRIFGLALSACVGPMLSAQEARAGFDVRATLTGETVASNELTDEPRSGSPMVAGFHGIAYPTIKFDDHWFITGAVQLATRPYFYADLSTLGYGAKGNVLQASLNYSRVSEKGSVLARAGELPTAFGAFALRYDDAENPLVDLPLEYGYYYAPVSIAGLAGAQIDATRSKWDSRVQFANSSPANPRSLFSHDQYGNWAGGGGYTIRQGFRVGASGYRGPYLDRHSAYFFPGEANPNTLPAHAFGLDANWAYGHTTVYAEAQRFVMKYKLIKTFRESAGYVEARQVLSARWFVASRFGIESNSAAGQTHVLETSAGFRANRFQLLKIGYEFEHYGSSSESSTHTLGIQFITTLHKAVGRE